MSIAHADRLIPALRRAVLASHSADRTDGQLLAAFVSAADADAFALLVRRHGPMVLGVCRRVVGDPHTADDAFQATFLVLARRAAAVRPREGVGNWLYGVAFRTAMKARAVLARRRSREKQVEAMPEPPARPPADPWPDLKPVIDEELARLPDRLRLPVVLCDLEGRPQRAVAKHLGVAPATLAARLATARRLLARRLTRRGVTLSGGALAGVLSGNASASVVPPALAAGVSRAAELTAAGAGVSGVVSAHAVSLSEGAMRMMFLTKLKLTATAVFTAFALAGVGVGVAPARADDEPAARPAAKPAPVARAAVPNIPDDLTFLRRLSLDLRGTTPTTLELVWFRDDRDEKKRDKVVGWLLGDDEVRAYLARKLGVPTDRIRVVRGDGRTYRPLVAPLVLDLDSTLSVRVLTDDGAHGPPSAVEKVNRVFAGHPGMIRPVNADPAEVIPAREIILNQRDLDLATATTVAGGRYTGWVELHRSAATNKSAGAPVYYDPRTADHLRVAVPPLGDAKPAEAGQAAEIAFLLAASMAPDDADGDFLRRAVTDARGTDPTELELKYFREDKDPKKREKLLNLLLKDAAVAKRLGDEWKKKLLAPPPAAGQYVPTNTHYFLYALQQAKPAPEPTRLDLLLNELLSVKKSDDQVLDAVTVAVVGRLPSEGEKKLTLAAVKAAKDRGEAWRAAAKALAETDEAKKHAERSAKERPAAKP